MAKTNNWSGYDEPDLPGEEWRPIANYDGLYEVSNLGRVRSVARTLEIKTKFGVRNTTYRQKLLRGGLNDKGYRAIMLCKDGDQRMKHVAPLVAAAFIPNPENKPEVNHRSGNKDDNSVVNLEWNTHRENCIHRSEVLLKNAGSNNKMSLFTDEQVREMRALYATGTISYSDVARKYGTPINTTYGAIIGRTYRFVT